jgi:hypothetical protein
VDTQSSPNFCGDCDTQCGGDEQCNAGVCESVDVGCPQDSCGDFGNGRRACIDPRWDNLNCGGCGEQCGVDEICSDGNCERYEVAVGCNSCPCNDVCDALLGNDPVCCGAPSGFAQPICVSDINPGECPP